MTNDLSIGIVVLETSEQCHQSVFLGWGACVGFLALGIETSLVADTDAVGVVMSGMGSYHFLWAALMELTILGDVIVIAYTFKASCLVAGFQR
jgi:hypothetical protein